MIPYLFRAFIFLTLLFLTEESLAQSVDSNDKTVPSVEGNSLENGQAYPDEAEQVSSTSPQPKESPMILEKAEGTTHQEGIGDAFSQDHRDRFQSKVESRPLAEGQPLNEKTTEVQPTKETPDAQKQTIK